MAATFANDNVMTTAETAVETAVARGQTRNLLTFVDMLARRTPGQEYGVKSGNSDGNSDSDGMLGMMTRVAEPDADCTRPHDFGALPWMTLDVTPALGTRSPVSEC
jgi:hypothetical protein